VKPSIERAEESGIWMVYFDDFGMDFEPVPNGRGRPFRVSVWNQGSCENFLAPTEINVANLRDIQALSDTLDRIAPEKLGSTDWLKTIHAAVRLLGEQPRQALQWHTAAELAAIVPASPDLLIGPFVTREAVTELGAKVKAGKTTLTAAMVAAKLNGTPFLGFTVERSPVVYMTEERGPSFLDALNRFGIRNHPDLHILLRHEAQGPWAELAEEARSKCQTVGADVLIADTLADWAGLKDDEENNTGSALAAMRPLQLAAADGLGVLVIRHDRKSGGDIGDSARGASAFSGAADILLSLRRADSAGHENRRVIHAVGRFDGIPSQTVVELRDGGYIALGDAVAVEQREVRAAVLDLLPETEEKALTIDQLTESIGQQRKATLNRVLESLRESGRVLRKKGYGDSKRAFGYWLASDEFFSKGNAHEKYDTDYVPESDVPIELFRGTYPENKELFTPHSLEEKLETLVCVRCRSKHFDEGELLCPECRADEAAS
jgi:hypothetical protein